MYTKPCGVPGRASGPAQVGGMGPVRFGIRPSKRFPERWARRHHGALRQAMYDACRLGVALHVGPVRRARWHARVTRRLAARRRLPPNPRRRRRAMPPPARGRRGRIGHRAPPGSVRTLPGPKKWESLPCTAAPARAAASTGSPPCRRTCADRSDAVQAGPAVPGAPPGESRRPGQTESPPRLQAEVHPETGFPDSRSPMRGPPPCRCGPVSPRAAIARLATTRTRTTADR